MTSPGQVVEYEMTGDLIAVLGSLCVASDEAQGMSAERKSWGPMHRSLRDRWRSLNPDDRTAVAELKADVVDLIQELR